jgi:hypothetical protein
VLRKAEQAAATAASWADLSNELFNPTDGLVTVAYPTRPDREAFARTPDYRAIRALVTAAMDRHGMVEGATPKKSGRFIVRLPKSLHAALEQEASAEGVSLNQLVVAKLTVRLDKLVGSANR